LPNIKTVNIESLLKSEKLVDCELIVVAMIGLRPLMKPGVPKVLMQAHLAGV